MWAIVWIFAFFRDLILYVKYKKKDRKKWVLREADERTSEHVDSNRLQVWGMARLNGTMRSYAGLGSKRKEKRSLAISGQRIGAPVGVLKRTTEFSGY